MNNQIFQPSRFIFYLRRTIFERKTSLINASAVYLCLAIAICLGLPYINGYYLPGATNLTGVPYSSDPMWGKELKFFMFLWLSAGIMCSDFFSPLQKKRDRIVLFTTPASNLEKFTTFFILYVITIPLVMAMFYLFADAVRVWVYSGIYQDCNYIHYLPVDFLLSFGTAPKYIILGASEISPEEFSFINNAAFAKFSFILLGGLWLQALYTLGSAVWPKKNAFKTSVFLLGMGLVCGTLFYYGLRAFYGHTPIEPRSFGIYDTFTKLVVLDLCVVALILFTWWIAYRRFKEWEVVKRW